MNINLHIERLILEGVNISPGQRHMLQASVETELARLMTRGGVATRLTGGGTLPRIASPAIKLNGSGSPIELGRQIASSVYSGIGK